MAEANDRFQQEVAEEIVRELGNGSYVIKYEANTYRSIIETKSNMDEVIDIGLMVLEDMVDDPYEYFDLQVTDASNYGHAMPFGNTYGLTVLL